MVVRKRLGMVAGGSVLVAILAFGGAWNLRDRAGNDDTAAAAPNAGKRLGTAEVITTDLADYVTEAGTLGYKKGRTLHGVGDGLVTWLPKPGTTVARGESLFRVDDRPVVLLYGRTPLFRELATVGTVGRDVKVLADNLRALGYPIGDQPAAGTFLSVTGPEPDVPATATATATAAPKSTTSPKSPASPTSYRVRVRAQDGVFTAALKAALARWQSDQGMNPPTGVFRFGDAVVLPGRVRIGELSARVGDAASQELMSVTARTKSVSALIAVDQADDIEVDDKVRITLPDSSFTSGTVSAVSATVRPKAGDDPVDGSDQPKVEITITVDQPSRIKKISSADVEVRFVGTTKRQVLAVPVGALLALSGGGYAVQIAGGALVPVEAGFFADGLVEITAPGLAAGTKVVTTS